MQRTNGPLERPVCCRTCGLRGLFMQGPLEVANFTFGVVLLPAVALLQSADKILMIAVGAAQIIVGEFAPLRFQRTLQLRPLALDDVLIHRFLQ